MANNEEQVSARLNQFKGPLSSFLSEGGVLLAGKVTKKNNYPAKDGKNPSWSVQLGVFGQTFLVSVSQKLWDTIGVGSYQVFPVMQRGYGKAIYNTVVED